MYDYVDQFDASTVNVDVSPALGRAKDVIYVAKKGDTIKKLAKQFYGNEALSTLISGVDVNDTFINADGSIKKGARILIPYAPIPQEYRVPDLVDTAKNTLSDVVDIFSGITF